MRWRIPRPRFSLFALLALITLAGYSLHVFLGPLERTRAQEEAIDRLQKPGAWLMACWEPAAEPWCGWLEKITGTRCRNVVSIDMHWRCPPEDATELLHFRKLRELEFYFGITDDAVLKTVSELRELESLQVHLLLERNKPEPFDNAKLPQAPRNEGVRHLAKLTNLKTLILSSAARFEPPKQWHFYVDDEGLAPVLAAAPIERLVVSGTRMTMTSLRPLLQKKTLHSATLPPAFAANLDELLADPTLKSIDIFELPQDRLARDRRLSNQGTIYHWGSTLSLQSVRYEKGKPPVSHGP